MTVIKLQTQTFKKPNSALVMVPKVGRLTPVSRKLYNVLLQQTQQQIQDSKTGNTTLDARHLFSAPLKDMLAMISVNSSNPMTSAKKYLTEMRRTEVDWEAPDATSGIFWRSMGLLSEVEMENINGIIWVRWALPPSLLMAVADPERYTPINLSQMSKLISYTAIALYEICSRYRKNPTGVTSRHSPEWWVEALTNAPPPLDAVTGKPRLREWRKIKSASVLAAMEEIEKNTDLVLTLHEIKVGKAVKEIQFGVQEKRIAIEILQPTISSELAQAVAKLGIEIKEAAKLIGGGCSEVTMKISLAKLESRMNQLDLAPIENKLAYLRKLIIENGQFISDKTVPMPINTSTSDLFEQKPTWADVRRKQVRDELIKLPKSQQQQYADIAVQKLQERKLDSPTILRKYRAGEWLTGMMAVVFVSAYGEAIYGSNWLTEPSAISA
jgi:hypothetical protein